MSAEGVRRDKAVLSSGCKMLWGGRRGNCIHRRFCEPIEGAPHAISE